MGEKLVEFEYQRFKDGPDVPVAENPHFFALIRFLGLISNTSMAIEWNFEDVQTTFESVELTEYSRNLHLKLLGFLGKRFPPHVTLERNISKFLDERPIDVGELFWDQIISTSDGQNEIDSEEEDKKTVTINNSQSDNKNDDLKNQENESRIDGIQESKSKSKSGSNRNKSKCKNDNEEVKENRLYNPYRDKEYRDVKKHERLRAIRIIINVCIQESRQLRNILQGMEGYSLKCNNVVPGECFFGSSPPYIGDDKLGHHYWYINLPNDDVIFRLYRESSKTGELTLISDNSDTLCSTYKTFLNDDSLQEVGLILESKYNSLVVAEKAKLRKIRQMRSIRNQLESSWGNCAPTDEMLSGGRTKRKAAMNVDYYSYTRNEGITGTRRSSRINKYNYDSDSISDSNNNTVKDRSNRLANRNAKKQLIEDIEKEKDNSDSFVDLKDDFDASIDKVGVRLSNSEIDGYKTVDRQLSELEPTIPNNTKKDYSFDSLNSVPTVHEMSDKSENIPEAKTAVLENEKELDKACSPAILTNTVNPNFNINVSQIPAIPQIQTIQQISGTQQNQNPVLSGAPIVSTVMQANLIGFPNSSIRTITGVSTNPMVLQQNLNTAPLQVTNHLQNAQVDGSHIKNTHCPWKNLNLECSNKSINTGFNGNGNNNNHS
ncbi:apicomplexan conserved protein [Cryptosporidium bovis]|uniref:apicomplexan conserved protein n=1 Tax=Cryptosporidium bovis TaxID=310047 RepID=UPI00351A2172|nr:apicomplexan conserved protein [Cryptosporidium bovis]